MYENDEKRRFVVEKKGLYLFHEDNVGSYESVEVGDTMYFTAYTSEDLVVDGYNARVGTPSQFQFKYVVDYEIIEHDLVEYEDDCFEVVYGRVIRVYDEDGNVIDE